jgi:hypothetical protein
MRRFGSLLLIVLLLGAVGCSTPSAKRRQAIYGPTESVIEVVAVLRRHVPDDTYRFPPATEFTGRNVYRASLLRLENLERMHDEALRAGHMDPVIAFAKGRALERLRAYDLAAEHYGVAAERDAVLREEALRSQAFCRELQEAVGIGIDLAEPVPSTPEESMLPPDPEPVIADLERRVARLAALLAHAEEQGEPHYGVLAREEIERADVTRARYFAAMRNAIADGPVRAVAELQRVVARHAPSKLQNRHVLDLANFYALLAEEYVEAHPPESLGFDPPRFRELVDAASRLYQSVAARDGTPEKLEAARRFEAFLAFTIQVDRDRFTP